MSRSKPLPHLKSSFIRSVLIGFVAGFFAVLLFHQGLLSVFYALGIVSFKAFSFKPTLPFGVPVVLSSSFWGGIWGILFAISIARFLRGVNYWVASILGGAFILSFVAGFVVAPLKGMPVAFGYNIQVICMVLLLNGAWGFGTALFYRLLQRR